MNRNLIQLLHASMIAALLPLAACMAGEPEDEDDEDVAAVEGELELGIVEEGAGAPDEGAEEDAVDLDIPGLDSPLQDLDTSGYKAAGQTLPGADRMAEPIPYPSDDPPKDAQMWPGDPSDPLPKRN